MVDACNDIVSNNEKYPIVHVASTSADNWFITFTYISSHAANTAANSIVYLLYNTLIARKTRCKRQSEKKKIPSKMRNDQKLSFYPFVVVVLELPLTPALCVSLVAFVFLAVVSVYFSVFVCLSSASCNQFGPALFICLKLYLWKRDRMRLFCTENITKVDSTCVLMRIYTLFATPNLAATVWTNNVKCDDDGICNDDGWHASGVHCTPVRELQLHILNL